MSTTILEVRDLTFTYPNGYQALKGVNLKVSKGERIACLGSNGSGKSTFFLCLNGIHKPDSGQICYDSEPVSYSRKGLLKLRSKVGIVFQEPDNQLFLSDILQEISFGILNKGVAAESAREKVEQIIEELEITPYRKTPTHALSGGQKKQVAIADILVMEPDIIILDEPTAALDPKHSRLVKQRIHDLSDHGYTIMLSTHDVDHALAWADRIILFHDGQIIKEGSPEEIFSDPAVLATTNLEQPAVIALFEKMKAKHILPEGLSYPRSVEELSDYL